MKATKILIAATLSCLLLAGCSTADTGRKEGATMEKSAYQQVSMEEAMELMKTEENYIILDVRRQRNTTRNIFQYNSGTKRDYRNERYTEPDKDQTILVYCRSGNRSKQAAEKLAALGYTNIIEFGGINDWPGEVEISEQ